MPRLRFLFLPLTCGGCRDVDPELDFPHGHGLLCVRSHRRELVARLRRSPARCRGHATYARAGPWAASGSGGPTWEQQPARGRKAAEVASDEGLGWLFVAGATGPVSLWEQRGRGGGGARDGLSSGGGRTSGSHRGAGKVSFSFGTSCVGIRSCAKFRGGLCCFGRFRRRLEGNPSMRLPRVRVVRYWQRVFIAWRSVVC